MEAPNNGFTVILLTNPGAPARQMRVPRNWPVFVGMFSLLSLGGSLFAGRQARALCEPEDASHEPAMLAPAQDENLFRGPAWDADNDAVSSVGSRPQGLRGDDDTMLVSSHGLGTKVRADLGAATPKPSQAAPTALPVAPLPIKGLEPGAPRPLLSGKMLSLFDVNAGRPLKVMPFDQNGVPNGEAFAQIRSFMRCRRSGHEIDMDPKLIAVLSRISQHFGDATLQVISGHRKPDGKATRETSQHAFGTAADIRVPGVSIETVRQAAKDLGAKGIGLYAKSQFVHVDVRAKAYSWRDNGEETGADLATDLLPETLADKPTAEAPEL